MIRSSSPAMSEISVGSPSPPPPQRQFLLAAASRAPLQNGFQVLPAMKRLKTHLETPQHRDFLPPMPQRRKSSNERVKSFSIADILGKREDVPESNRSETPPPHSAIPPVMAVPSTFTSIPASHALSVAAVGPSAAPLLMLDLPSIHKVMPPSWGDPSRLTAVPNASSTSLPLHPFFPPALLHYEQRLAWDYQRQLQEHFHAQAQLLRQMSMDPNIIPSEDGSERGGSRDSSSAGSQCCSPDVNVASDDGDEENVERSESKRLSHERLSNAETEGSTKSAAEKSCKHQNDTPLDALFQLSTKNFDEDQDPATLNIFATRPNPKKKRKSRTAFTNHQIFELEKRFLYQKYLSPADRDEIAGGLGLSNAQVITWFQNRRAKLKRDMEELKKDVESVKQLSAHKSFLENVNDLSILKTRPVSRHHQQPHQRHSEVIHSAAPTHGNLGTSTGAAPAAAPAGPSPTVQHQPTTIPLPLPHPHPHIITTSTCNEIGETQPTITTTTSTSPTITTASNSPSEVSSARSPADSGQPQVNHHHINMQHQPRNLQINSSRG